jgi:hypothetical protein
MSDDLFPAETPAVVPETKKARKQGLKPVAKVNKKVAKYIGYFQKVVDYTAKWGTEEGAPDAAKSVQSAASNIGAEFGVLVAALSNLPADYKPPRAKGAGGGAKARPIVVGEIVRVKDANVESFTEMIPGADPTKLTVTGISKDGKMLRVTLSDGSAYTIARSEVKHNKKVAAPVAA